MGTAFYRERGARACPERLPCAMSRGFGDEKLPTISAAIKKLDGLKFLLRIAWEIKVLDSVKYAALSEPLFEIGKMLGGWKKGLDTKTPAH